MTVHEMTTHAQQNVTQMYCISIKAVPQAIWDAITRPNDTARYFYGARVQTATEVGSPFRYRAPDGDSLWSDATVEESDPPRRIVVGWRWLYDSDFTDEPANREALDTEPNDGRFSKLNLVHDRLNGSPNTAADVSGGWMMVLSGMMMLLETGGSLVEA
jgi:uncharacterized protein YndB with AHSA1/START domain